jgi:hypothetical protein
MAKQLQLFFDEIAEKKQEEKEILMMYRDALKNNPEYVNLIADLGEIREKKQRIEFQTLVQLGSNADKLAEIKDELKAEKEAMTDAALRDLMDGKTVTVKDSLDREYEPVWSVRFIKTK